MIESKDVAYVAKLAHLHMSDEDMVKFAGQLNEILEHVNQLSELDDVLEKEGIEPTMHTWPVTETTLREDVIEPSLDAAHILSECADVKEGAFCVPKIIEGT